MVNDRDKRRLDLEGMTQVKFSKEFEQVFGEGAGPANPANAVNTILDKEFGAKPKVYFSNKCDYCKKVFPSTATPVEQDDDGTLCYKVHCMVCKKWTTTYGQDSEDLSRNFEVPDNTDYSGLDK